MTQSVLSEILEQYECEWEVSTVEAHFRSCLDDFSEIALGEDVGLLAFDWNDVSQYLQHPEQFNFSLKRRVGEGVLYGVDHALRRRQFFNKLPKSLRHQIFLKKATYYEISSYIQSYIGYDLTTLVDVKDIGMGHSIYKITLQTETGNKSWVLKEKDVDLQIFYCKLLQVLQWPSFQTYHLENNKGSWELSEFLGERNLNDRVQENEALVHLERALAHQAALGDLLGRGDRHLENYVVVGSSVFPIDISYLFWPDNEMWTEKYSAGGVYELSLLGAQYNGDENALMTHVKQFWEFYWEGMMHIKANQKEITALITRVFKGQDQNRYCAYFQMQLSQLDGYYQTQKKKCTKAFFESQRRSIYKDLLKSLYEKKPRVLSESPLLYMYYLADLKRSSAFLHSETQKIVLFEEIVTMSRPYFEDIETSVQKKMTDCETLEEKTLQLLDAV
ncbi:hypothetical protein DID77_01055 [Candidatus Marinamargulisbacteria bacterium SCGC AG-439-L15]|nr:hypothetical protein DID77_01055 [Candidatus Marinamargulisbacteria bacterium SCGC AG-439-L15]